MQKSQKDEGLLYMSLNQDQSCLVVGTENGFKLYDTIPFKLRYQRGKHKNKYNNNNYIIVLIFQFWTVVSEL
jgi:hypothetical protein